MSEQWKDIVAAIEEKCLNLHSKAKCLDKKRLPQNYLDTLNEYFVLYNDTSEYLHQIYTTVDLTTEHKRTITRTFTGIRDKVIKVFSRHSWNYYVPQHLGGKLDLDTLNDEDSEDDDMPETVADVIKAADSIVKSYDGSVTKLQGFLDSLELVKTVMSTHEATVVTFIKSRLSGPARDCINETVNSVDRMIAALRNSIKTPSSGELEAKLHSLSAYKKDRSVFCNEMQELANALKHAYITEGLNNQIAEQYAARETKKAIVANSIDKDLHTTFRDRKIETISEVMTAYGEVKQAHQQLNTIRRLQGRGGNRNNNFRGRNGRNGRGNHHNNNNQNRNNNGNFNNNRGNGHRGNHRGNNNNYRGGNNNNNNSNIRHMDQGNGQAAHQGAQNQHS